MEKLIYILGGMLFFSSIILWFSIREIQKMTKNNINEY